MSFSKMLEKLLAALITAVGPALIELILKWVQGLGEEEIKEVAKNVSASLEKNLKV